MNSKAYQLTVLVLLANLTAPAAAITNHWIGASDGRWSDTNNWDTQLVPNSYRGGSPFDVFWTNHPVSVTLDGDQWVEIRNFTFTTPGRLGGTNLMIDGNLDWSSGVMAGPGYTLVGTNATLHGSAPDYIVLENRGANFGGMTRLTSVLRMDHRPGISQRASILITSWNGPFEALDGAAIELVPPSLAAASDLVNSGTFRIPDGTIPFRCEAGFENRSLVEVGARTVVFAGGFTQATATAGKSLMLRLNGGMIQTASASSGLSISHGSLQGTGQIDRAVMAATALKQPVLSGQIGFGELSLGAGAKVRITVGGRADDSFDHFTIGNAVTLGGRIEVAFTNGFETSVRPEDEFEIFTLAPGSTVAGAFENAAFENFLATADGSGFFSLHFRAPGPVEPGAVVLRDFSTNVPPFVLDSVPETASYPLGWPDPLTCVFAPSASLRVRAGIGWAGGVLRLQIMDGLDPATDHLGLRQTPRLTAAWTGPGHGVLRFDGTQFAALTNAGAELTCHFEAGATREAIEGLLQNLQWTNRAFKSSAFTNAAVRFADRTVQWTLTEPGGFSTNLHQAIEFPYLTGIRSASRVVVITLGGSQALLTVNGLFSDGTVRDLPCLDLAFRSPCIPSSLRVGRDSPPCGYIWIDGYRFSQCALTIEAGPLTDEICVDIRSWICPLLWISATGLCLAEASPGPTSLRGGARNGVTSNSFSPASFYALETLMNQTEEGRRLAGLYRKHALEVVNIFANHPELIDQAQALVATFEPAVVALLSGQGQQAQITQAMIDQLNSAWDQLVNYASPGLQAALVTERGRFRGFQDFVDKDFSQWAAMLEIPAPSQPRIYLVNPALRNGRFSVQANHVAGVALSLWRSADLLQWEEVPAAQTQLSSPDEYTVELIDLSPLPGTLFYKVQARPLPAAPK